MDGYYPTGKMNLPVVEEKAQVPEKISSFPKTISDQLI